MTHCKMIWIRTTLLLEEYKSHHYLFHSKKYRRNPKQWQEFFDDNFYNESEFREHFCLSRSSFILLYHLVKSHPAFSSQKKRWPQPHVKLQLLIFLYKLSCSSTGGKFTITGKYFKVSKGNARSCFHRSTPVPALLVQSLAQYYALSISLIFTHTAFSVHSILIRWKETITGTSIVSRITIHWHVAL